MSCFLRTVASSHGHAWQDEAELVVATLRAGLAEKGKAWLQQEVKAQPQLCALARQLDARQRVAGGKVTKADLAAAVVEQLCGQVGSKAAQSCVFFSVFLF